MRIGKALLPRARAVAGPVAQADAHCPAGGQSTPLEMGRKRMLGTPCPAVLPAEQEMGYGCVYYQEEEK